MEIRLDGEMFENGRFVARCGDWEVLFIIVDEEFPGNNDLGRINRIVIEARKHGPAGEVGTAQFQTTVIGLRAGIVGIRSPNPALRGKLLTKDNMEECVVMVYENG